MSSAISEADARKVFNSMDTDSSGTITEDELRACMSTLYNKEFSAAEVKKCLAAADTNQDGTVDFAEFLVALQSAGDETGTAPDFSAVAHKQAKLVQVAGHSGTHSFSEEEMAAFTEHINNVLGNDPELAYLLPLQASNMDSLPKAVFDGVLLAKFINVAVPDTIDERALNKRKGDKDLSTFQINENLNLVINAAKSIGVQTVNVGAGEIREGTKFPHLVLGMVWQLVKIQLLSSIDLKNHPELIRLLEDGEELSDLLKLPPEQLLLRWFNYHLKNAGHSRRVRNFGPDVKDSENYAVLLHQIAPAECDQATEVTRLDDPVARAERVLQNAGRLNVQAFITPQDIAKGNPRLNLAFTAAIFNMRPGLEELTQEELEKAGLMDDDFGDSREERAFRMWINSLNIDGIYINSLFEDCKDGLALLKVMDFVEPGSVDWKKVEKKPKNKFMRVTNCNHVIDVGLKAPFKFSLVGIGGTDIVDGNKKLVLALVWQLMRHHTLKFLAQVAKDHFSGDVSEQQLIDWANRRVKNAGRPSQMSSLKDKSLADSLFFMDLLFSVEKRVIDWDFVVADAKEEEDRINNARYAISVTRKLGGTIFVLPEDIVEVKPKMILTMLASIAAIAK